MIRSRASGLATWAVAHQTHNVAPGSSLLQAPASSNTNLTREQRERAALLRFAPVFGIESPDSHLIFWDRQTESTGKSRVRYRQVHRGVPVFSGILHVHLDANDEAAAANGRFYPLAEDFAIDPMISEAAAGVVASDWTGGSVKVMSTELVIVDPGWYGDPMIGPHLAYYVVTADTTRGAEEAFFVDARNGEVLDRWSLVCTALDRRIYDAFGLTQLPGGLIRSEGEPPTGDAEIDKLYDYIGDSYDYFQRGFGRDSYDGLGSPIVASAYYDAFNCDDFPNASWSFVFRQMYFCESMTVDDIIAHEFTHGVTQYTGNMIYQNQAGQLNESFSDIFGELVDLFNGGAAFVGEVDVTPWTDHPSGPGSDWANQLRSTFFCSYGSEDFPEGVRWLIAEDSPAFFDGLRDMWDPTCFGHPDHANSNLQGCTLFDNGGVHSGSGVLNHAFAIACDGKTFNGQTVSGIGPIKAGAIWYRALSTYMHVASDFEDAYFAINQAANDLVGTVPLDPRTGLASDSAITAADAAEVNKALLAVELNSPGACGETVALLDSTEPPACADEVILFSDSFEGGAGGWTVSNTGPTTPYDWALTSSLPFERPGTAWRCDDPNFGDCSPESPESAIHSLTSPEMLVPTGLQTLTLSFAHFIETEPRFDGGTVSMRINGGPWFLIPTVAYFYNRHNTSFFNVVQGSTNPLAGQVAFSGVGGDWGTTLVDLGAFANSGDALQLRFDFAKDDCFGFTGWFIDDVRVFGCVSSGDCDGNGVPDEMDEQLGSGPTVLLRQVPNRSSGNLSDADPHPSLGVNTLAENFMLIRNATIEKVRVWGGYTGNAANVPDSFTVRMFASAGGVPGTLISSQQGVASSRIATNRIFQNVSEYEYELTLTTPVLLAAGNYIIEIFNNTTGLTTTWIWERAFFGWLPGCARQGQDCPVYCFEPNLNFSIDLLGEYDGVRRGDVNLDDAVAPSDIGPFVAALLHGAVGDEVLCAADIDRDGDADGFDIQGFVECVLAGGCP